MPTPPFRFIVRGAGAVAEKSPVMTPTRFISIGLFRGERTTVSPAASAAARKQMPIMDTSEGMDKHVLAWRARHLFAGFIFRST